MYILPNTNIKLLSGVPIDKGYRNTLWFEDKTSQFEYFNGKTKRTYLKCTYQRQTKSIRLDGKYDDVYSCNYLMYQNTSYGHKWFYAFIDNIEYVNDNAFEVYFTIDVMQTWFFDYALRECFVEREHSVTDVVGENIVSESFELGDITCNDIQASGHFNSYSVVICKATTGSDVGGYYGGIFSGCEYIPALVDNDSQVKSLLNYLTTLVQANEQDSVASMFMMPSKFYTNSSAPVVEVNRVEKPSKIHGYTPRNKKLLTYPYNYLSVDCGNNDAIYRYEWFISEYCDFALIGCMSCNPQISLVPKAYNGTTGSEFNYTEKLVMEGFPQVSWSTDSFKAWLAQEASSVALQGLGSALRVGIGIGSGNPAYTGGGALGLASTINDVVLAYNRPPQAKGINSGTVDVATRTKDFWFKQMQITQDYAILIDEYFDMYGYATRAVKKPNRSARPHWNYVKTDGCIIIGEMPSDAIRTICSIYDNGVTFWKNGDEVGNYSLNNSPT